METYKRLYRSNHDVMIAGVAGGLAEYFNLDPTIVRLLFVLLAFVSVGVPMALIYLILWIIMPRNPGV
jgi:phage shock protein C